MMSVSVCLSVSFIESIEARVTKFSEYSVYNKMTSYSIFYIHPSTTEGITGHLKYGGVNAHILSFVAKGRMWSLSGWQDAKAKYRVKSSGRRLIVL